MNSPILFIIISLGVLTGIVMIALVLARKNASETNEEKHPQGYWLGMGMSFGMLTGGVLGLIASILTENKTLFIPIGPGAGLALGVAIGSVLEKKHQDELRPVNETKTKRQRLTLLVGLGLLVIVGVVAMLLVIAS